MIINEVDNLNIQDFNEEFKKKFTSFCEKSPLYLAFNIRGNKVEIIDKSYTEEKNDIYTLNYLYTTKLNIKNIRTMLEKRYPVIKYNVKQPLSNDKMNEYLNEGKSVEEVLDMSEEKVIDKYKLMKVLHGTNELIVEDLEEGTLKLLGCKLPIISILEAIHNCNSDLGGTFERRTYFKKNLKKVNKG